MNQFVDYKEYKKNRSIESVIKYFANKERGRVVESRKEIQKRFAFQDWTVQKKILSLFLQSGKSDREWALTRAFQMWDDSFQEQVRQLWDEYHEERCSWVIIRHFPIEYIKEHMESLSAGRNYFFICRRLGKDMGIIERDRMSDLDYLTLLDETGESLDSKEAIDIVFKCVHTLCTDKVGYFDIPNVVHSSIVSMMNFSSIRKALYHLRNIGLDDVADDFERWNDGVIERIQNSEEYDNLCKKVMDDQAYRIEATGICFIYSYKALDDKYKKSTDPSIQNMKMPLKYYITYVDGSLPLHPSDLPF